MSKINVDAGINGTAILDCTGERIPCVLFREELESGEIDEIIVWNFTTEELAECEWEDIDYYDISRYDAEIATFIANE